MTATPEQVKRLCAASGRGRDRRALCPRAPERGPAGGPSGAGAAGQRPAPSPRWILYHRPQGSTGPASALPVANAGGRRTGGWRRNQEMSPRRAWRSLRDLAGGA